MGDDPAPAKKCSPPRAVDGRHAPPLETASDETGEEEDAEDGGSCSVCMARPRTVRNLPCEHALCCELCTLRLLERAQECGGGGGGAALLRLRCPNAGRCSVARLAFAPLRVGLEPPRLTRLRTYEGAGGATVFET